MTERIKTNDKLPQPMNALEALVRTEEIVQFNDGYMGILFRAQGHTIDWDMHKYSRGLDGESSSNCAIIKTSNGRRFAFGRGMSIVLPELDAQTGTFSKVGETTAASLEAIAPNGLPDLEIGQRWKVLDNQGTVESVMLRYKTTVPGNDAYTQVDMPNYFDDALRLLEKASQQMSAMTAGGLAVHQTRQQ